MSATLNAAKFAAYFDTSALMHIEGRNHEVKMKYLSQSPLSHVRAAADTVIKLCRTGDDGNILVFLPGEEEIKTVCRIVTKHTQGLEVCPLTAKMTTSEQARAVTPGETRKCIVSTNVAESSLTIDNVAYVVDTG